MLRPVALQAALQALVDADETSADVALLVLAESGSIYAQAHGRRSQVQDTNEGDRRRRKGQTAALSDVQKSQLLHQPGLTILMSGTGRHESSSNIAAQVNHGAKGAGTSHNGMALGLTADERARVIAGVACQSWTEEVARVRRLRTNIQGSFSLDRGRGLGAMANSITHSVGASNGAMGKGSVQDPYKQSQARASEDKRQEHHDMLAKDSNNLEDENGIEHVDPLVAIAGSRTHSDSSNGGIAPLLLETELGVLVVMPLPIPTASSPKVDANVAMGVANECPLLLVLGAYPPARAAQRTLQEAGKRGESGSKSDVAASANVLPRLGSSILSQDDWNSLYVVAQSFADFVSPALRRAFGDADDAHDAHDADEAHGGAGGEGSGQAQGAHKQRGAIGHVSGSAHGGNKHVSRTIFSDDRESAASQGGAVAAQDRLDASL